MGFFSIMLSPHLHISSKLPFQKTRKRCLTTYKPLQTLPPPKNHLLKRISVFDNLYNIWGGENFITLSTTTQVQISFSLDEIINQSGSTVSPFISIKELVLPQYRLGRGGADCYKPLPYFLP